MEPWDQFYVLPGDSKEVVRTKQEKARNAQNLFRDILSRGTLTAQQQSSFDKWVLTYEIPVMTQFTPEGLKEIPEARKKLLKDYLQNKSVPGAAHTSLVNHCFSEFSKIAVEDYHPAVRYNAMLIIGELNQREMTRSGAGTAPDPLVKALPYMLEQFENPDQIDAVRVAALLGIQRHAQIDAQNDAKPQEAKIPVPVLDKMTTMMLALVRTPQAPAGRTQEGHDWMRRRAVEVLSWIGHGKPNQEIVDELIARLSDTDENRGLRAEAARALGTVRYLPKNAPAGAAPLKVNPREVASQLAKFVAESTAADIKQVDKYIESIEEAMRLYSGAGGGSGFTGGEYDGMRPGRSTRISGSGRRPPGGMPGMSGGSSYSGGYGMSSLQGADPYAYRIQPVYRRLRYEITCAMQGLRGTDDFRKTQTPTAGVQVLIEGIKTFDEDKKFFDAVGKALQELTVKLKVKEEELDTEVFSTEVKKLAEAVELAATIIGAAAKAPPGKAPAGKGPATKTKPAPAVDLEPPEEPDPAAEPAPAAAKAAAPKAAAPKPATPAPADPPDTPE